MSAREIKFRAWSEQLKQMVDLKKITPLAVDPEVLKEGDGLFIPFAEGIILMQFTGLRDKNGKEIYEGDIVLFGENPLHENTHGKVIYSEKRAQFIYEFINGNHKGNCTDMHDDWRTYEVIGNIYESPAKASS